MADIPENSKAFDLAIGRFLTHIESVWTTLPLVIETTSKASNDAIQTHRTFLKDKCDYVEKEGHYIVPAELARRNTLLRKSATNSIVAKKIVTRNFLVSLFSQFDIYVSDLARAVFDLKPHILNESEKQLKYSDLAGFSSIDHAREYIIEKEIESLLRQNYTEQFKWFESKLKLKLRTDLPIWPTFIEASQRRHLFVHADGKVSNQYLTVCKEHKVDLNGINLGDELQLDTNYFRTSFGALFEIGVKLNQVLRRKLLPEEIEFADKSFLDISFELIENRQYELAKELYDFSDKYIKKFSNDDIELRILLNRAQTYKWLDEHDRCCEIVKGVDWSAKSDLFKLASNVLLDDFKSAAENMKAIGDQEKVINKTAYKQWPIFKAFRNAEEFKNAYAEIYGESFEITEEDK